MTKIIAEIGTNHEGSLDLACEMIERFAEAGADIVKFQAFVVEDMIPKDAPYYERMRQLEVKESWYPVLIKTAERAGVEFLSTATSFRSLAWMEAAGAKMYKVASGNATHYPILDRQIEIGKPVILSLGLLDLGEIVELVDYFKKRDFKELSLLHCHVAYPTPPERANLGNIVLLQELFEDLTIGYSDHTLSLTAPAVAVALGARIVEKHVYLKKGNLGMDYDAAISLDGFREMVARIRECEAMTGRDFAIDPDVKFAYRRSFHAARTIERGEVLSWENIKISRPMNGIEPRHYREVLGQKAVRRIEAEAPIRWEDL